MFLVLIHVGFPNWKRYLFSTISVRKKRLPCFFLLSSQNLLFFTPSSCLFPYFSNPYCALSSFFLSLSLPLQCCLHLLFHSTDILYTSLVCVLKTYPSSLAWIETSTLSLPAFCFFPSHLLWLSQRGVLSQGQKGEVGSDLWLRGRQERERATEIRAMHSSCS